MDSYNSYTEAFFSRIVSQFLALHCEVTPGKNTAGRVLFRRFRDYWNEVTHEAKHPALLGQLRVELTERGFASSGGKWPLWYGLALRKKKLVKASNEETDISKMYQGQTSIDIDIYRAIAAKSLVPGPAYC